MVAAAGGVVALLDSVSVNRHLKRLELAKSKLQLVELYAKLGIHPDVTSDVSAGLRAEILRLVRPEPSRAALIPWGFKGAAPFLEKPRLKAAVQALGSAVLWLLFIVCCWVVIRLGWFPLIQGEETNMPWMLYLLSGSVAMGILVFFNWRSYNPAHPTDTTRVDQDRTRL